MRFGINRRWTSPNTLITQKHWHTSEKLPDQGPLSFSTAESVVDFHARELHLMLRQTIDGKPVRFRVTIDRQAPGQNHGVETDCQGKGP